MKIIFTKKNITIILCIVINAHQTAINRWYVDESKHIGAPACIVGKNAQKIKIIIFSLHLLGYVNLAGFVINYPIR